MSEFGSWYDQGISKAMMSPQFPFQRVYHGTKSSAGRKIIRSGKFKRSKLHNNKERNQTWVSPDRTKANDYAYEGGAGSKAKGKPTVVEAIGLGKPSFTNDAGDVLTWNPKRLVPIKREPPGQVSPMEREWKQLDRIHQTKTRAKARKINWRKNDKFL